VGLRLGFCVCGCFGWWGFLVVIIFFLVVLSGVGVFAVCVCLGFYVCVGLWGWGGLFLVGWIVV